MSKYRFKITQHNSNFKCIDDWEEGISDESKGLAIDIIQRAYPEREGYKCELIEIYE